MTTYAVEWHIGRYVLDHQAEVIETMRERGYPHSINLKDGSVLVHYEVGGEIADLWDLRGVVEEVAHELGAYYDDAPVAYSRPVEVPDA